MKNSIKTIKTIVTVFAFVFTTSVMAQGPGGFDDNVVDVPLDGGLAVLIVGAAAYGVKKLRQNKNEEL
ncbi:MAG: hypothetical protein P8K68_06755 [Algibacter sp.]|uniref:PID-CTERM protein-sorting domain-containing protein n=1 Tax=Algibacter sp. TaxID=1872428 RepID=UPI002634EBFD|nr:hypothetical protein [Algibacter sp.]MDG1728677.1 hypothetical protein [Algibacter sp.]MDG2178474.1 hypothetical protein [Algibacter sp.]